MEVERSPVDAKIHQIRLRLQNLNHKRQSNIEFTEVRSHQITANNIFNQILKHLEDVSSASKKPIEQLTIRLVELTDESRRKHQEQMLVKLEKLDGDIDHFEQTMIGSINQIKHQGLQDMTLVLYNCLDVTKVESEIGKEFKEMREETSRRDEVFKDLQTELTLNKQKSKSENKIWAERVMNLESELETTKRKLLRQTQERRKSQEQMQKKLEDIQTIMLMQSKQVIMLRQISVLNNKLISEQGRVWLLDQLKLVLGSPIKDVTTLFVASQNDFQSERFHKICDNQPNLLIVVRCKDTPHTFGSFTDKQYGSMEPSETSFLFSITNKQLVKILPNSNATISDIAYGPWVGKGGYQITGNNVRSLYGYQQSCFCDGDKPHSKQFLFGAEYATIFDYDVYSVEFA